MRGPRLAAPPLGPRGLVSVPPFPLLGHRVGGRLRYASPARGAAAGALPGARPAPRRSALPDPWAPLGSPGSLLPDLRVDLRARGPVGPATTSADARRCSPQGGTCALSPSHPPLLGGGRGGTWSALGKHRAGPALKGGEAGLGSVLSLSRMRSRCGTPIPIVIAPVGTNRCRRIKPLRRPTVSILSPAAVVAPTALSPI